MFNEQIEKIELLINHQKFDLAQNEINQLLLENADDSYLYYLLSNVKYQQEKYDEANSLIDKSITLYPDSGFYYYFKVCIKLSSEKYNEVEDLLKTAIRIDPEIADYKSKFSQFRLLKKDYQSALELANESLELDPENILALNIRSTALLKLNRKEESFATIEGALREDPENSYTHSNYGWGLLEKGDHKKALDHFRESLKNNPNNGHAQSGMVEALKANYFIYRWYLKYSFFMENLTKKNQWIFIIGFYFGTKLLRSIAQNNEALQPYLTPIIILLSVFAFSTWVITPISNLLFRLNPYGKYLLDKKEKTSATFVGFCLILFILGLSTYFITKNENFIPVAAFGFVMMIPISVMFTPSKYKNLPLIITIIIGVIGILSIVTTFLTNELFNNFSLFFIIGFFAYQWLANFLMIKSNNI
ncbi:tetratricopeptide repeat protein [Flavobacterium sp.]|uniref:tetratricopeptide repeat protein n=1 Tax=Flavobacterium sp. TaxID=239 RepID=UPI00286E6BE2|nr:tetratricopeptide repeat protein [Flavobacterium sp.]